MSNFIFYKMGKCLVFYKMGKCLVFYKMGKCLVFAEQLTNNVLFLLLVVLSNGVLLLVYSEVLEQWSPIGSLEQWTPVEQWSPVGSLEQWSPVGSFDQ